jgi:hypothetical protein
LSNTNLTNIKGKLRCFGKVSSSCSTSGTRNIKVIFYNNDFPAVCRLIVEEVELPIEKRITWYCVFLAISLFVVGQLQMMFYLHSEQRILHLSLKVKTALIGMIYHKVLSTYWLINSLIDWLINYIITWTFHHRAQSQALILNLLEFTTNTTFVMFSVVGFISRHLWSNGMMIIWHDRKMNYIIQFLFRIIKWEKNTTLWKQFQTAIAKS